VDAVDPARLVARACSRMPGARIPARAITIVAAGKAAPGMLRGLLVEAPPIAGGLIAAQAPQPAVLPAGLHWIVASHPEPGEGSERAGRRALALAGSMDEGGLLVVLLSGGASSMLAMPAEGITLEEKAATARALMAAGASIAELNCVRKHLSMIKGGQLAEAAGWRVLTLAISDVHGPVEDDPSVIGSGPSVPDPSTFAEAHAIVSRYRLRCPAAVAARLDAGARGERAETPKPRGPGRPGFGYEVVGNRLTALAGMRTAAAAAGYDVVMIERATAGEARDAGDRLVEEAVRRLGRPGRDVCVLAAGETVVRVRGDGRGGRNQEFVLGAVPTLERLGAARVAAVLGSAGSDGIDGPTEAAGGMVDTASARRARHAGLDLDDALRRNDAFPALAALDDLLVWGPTGTNVGDLHVLLCAPARR
jgi:glycerate 2-kinase